MTTKNEPVGDSECPIKGCTESVPVFKYAASSTDTKRRRFAGRLYCACPIHGRVENQEYLLEHMKWRDGKKDAGTEGTPASDAAAAGSGQKDATVTTPVKKPATVAQPSAKRQAPPPAVKKPPATPEPEKPKTSSWLPDFFGSSNK